MGGEAFHRDIRGEISAGAARRQTFLILLLLALDVIGNYLVKYQETRSFAGFSALVHGSSCKSDDLLNIFSHADDVVEVLDLEHVLDDGASVQVVLV